MMLEIEKRVELEQYQCDKCGRMFYIDTNDKSDLDFNKYHCPYCKDETTHTRTILLNVEEID